MTCNIALHRIPASTFSACGMLISQETLKGLKSHIQGVARLIQGHTWLFCRS